MAKSFIERLTHEQIESFLDELYPKNLGFTYTLHFRCAKKYGNPCVCISISNSRNDFNHTFRLEEYDAQISFPTKWLKYLANVFGEEYIKSYLENCLSVFEDDDEH